MSTSKKDDKYNEKLREKYKEARTVRKIVIIVLSMIIIAMIATGVSGYFYIKNALQPVDPNSDEVTNVEIPLGSSVTTIAESLEENGIIHNSDVFRYYVKFKNESGFQAGSYDFTPAMTLDEIIESLKTGKILEEAIFTVTIPEGKTIEQIANIYANHVSSITEEEFLEKVNDRAYIDSLIDLYPTILSDEILNEDIITPLEGYLFAATYDFYKEDPTVEEIVNTMLMKTEEVVVQYTEQFEAYGYSMHEAITLASLVENEARTLEDRQMIQGVFNNRLETGMPLQTDPTVLYAHGWLGEPVDRVYFKDLEIDSPYNTYKYAGIPIGPISNFGQNSLQAVAEPIESNYFYFLAATADGKIHYSETLAEHERKIDQYIQN
ncbi:UPF0755 protein [Salirhabdus euzebyi]|uniref:Endolytic murein transglycosylase n=1 Tax=Salirhabdus euzebyi TaxID=394506 RepID=A0A841Q7T2_9BACI|nr:endolytic transglycosylase MltG [Salirhabdus euzebyi]MBB6454367.1 UPF0755 protein [Salirhabdus euzebyi]